jgi:hypothetical protein
LTPDAPNFAQARSARLRRALMFGFGFSLLAHIAFAADQPIEFDIPAQPLGLALSAYGAATGIQLFFAAELTEGHRSAALKGVFTPEIALKNLLVGSGLAARAIDDQGFTLVSLSSTRGGSAAVTPDAASPAALRFNAYSAAIQIAVRGALCRRKETTPGSYRALVRFWTSASGTVARTELVTSTGDNARDAMLSSALEGLDIGGAPPAALPQPVVLLLTSDGRSSEYCSEDRSVIGHAESGREAAR